MMPKANQNPSTQKIHLKYIRLPDRITTFCDELLYRSGKVIVGRSKVNSPNAVTFDGKVVLAQDFEIVYFEISRKWFTVVKVWNTRGEHTGYYCDIVTPFRMLSDDVIEQRDLFLDLWVSPDLRFKVLDQDELENALEKGWITKQLYEKAKKELERLVQSVKSKEFPPKLVIQLAEKLQL